MKKSVAERFAERRTHAKGKVRVGDIAKQPPYANEFEIARIEGSVAYDTDGKSYELANLVRADYSLGYMQGRGAA